AALFSTKRLIFATRRRSAAAWTNIDDWLKLAPLAGRTIDKRRQTMKRSLLAFVILALMMPLAAPSASPRAAKDEATLYRDEFGIPHVFAATLESACYAVGYAQAEDRLEELLKNYRR